MLPEEELAAGLAAHREQVREQVFAQMPGFVRVDAIAEAELVVERRILAEGSARYDRWQVALARGEARVKRDGALQPDVAVMTAAAHDFIRLRPRA